MCWQFANILCSFYFPQNLISVRNTPNKNLWKWAINTDIVKICPISRVTLDHVWPLRYITLTNPCVIYLYCFYVVSSTQNTHTSYIAISLHNINICNIYDVKYAFKHCMYTAYKRDMCWFVQQFGIALFSTCVYVSDSPMCNTLKDMLQFTR